MRVSRQRVQLWLFPTLICTHRACADYKFKQADEPPPHDDDEVRRREEEELQRVLELSMQDKGGRKNWNEYSLASSSSAGGSGSQASTARPPAEPSAPPSSVAPAHQPPYSNGYAPLPEPHAQAVPEPAPAPARVPVAAESSTESLPSAEPTSPTPSTEVFGVTRVRALHTFEPTEPNELAFEKGEIIKVVNREYKDWWRVQLRGRTGIFPVNYVVRLLSPLSLLSMFTCCRAGTPSGTHTDRASSRSTAGSRRVRTGSQRRSIVDNAAHSGPCKR